jgi:hypothetical protein
LEFYLPKIIQNPSESCSRTYSFFYFEQCELIAANLQILRGSHAFVHIFSLYSAPLNFKPVYFSAAKSSIVRRPELISARINSANRRLIAKSKRHATTHYCCGKCILSALRVAGALPGLQSAAAERLSASPLSPLVVLRSLARSFIP